MPSTATKQFNTAGPCRPEWHYMLPAAERLPEARPLIDERSYFAVHAPRQTGKTTALRALAWELTAEGRYAALHFSCEMGEPAGEDYGAATRAVISAIERSAGIYLPSELRPPPWPDGPPETRLRSGLAEWARACPRPLVLFFDEIDALRGESLRSVLRQIRDGFPQRPSAFPHAVILCGLRDVRDYRIASGGDPNRLGTLSPFNVKVASLRLGDFTEAETRTLLLQHTAATGQPFTDEALARVFELTQGQPWLTNALAKEVVEKIAPTPPPTPIEAGHIDEAKERLILARQTHLDSLVAKLGEERVRSVIQPILAGALPATDPTFDDDFTYVRDLGLIAPGNPLRLANPIYREVILRVLGAGVERGIVADPRSFVMADGRLDFPKLLHEFADFWCRHGAVLGLGRYHEVAPQLVVMAYLQRIVNGGGSIDREVAVGSGRIDIHVRWPYGGAGRKRALQEEALELKVWADGRRDPLQEGLGQLDAYLARLRLDEGTLVIFDRRESAPPAEERTRFEDARTPGGRRVTVLRA